MDVDMTSPPIVRGIGGVREVEEYGLKVQKLASVHSVTLFFVSGTFYAPSLGKAWHRFKHIPGAQSPRW